MAQLPVSHPSPVIRDVIAARVSRRDLLKGGLASGALTCRRQFRRLAVCQANRMPPPRSPRWAFPS